MLENSRLKAPTTTWPARSAKILGTGDYAFSQKLPEVLRKPSNLTRTVSAVRRFCLCNPKLGMQTQFQ